MRRKERAVTDCTRIAEIIRACDCCRLGLRDGDGVYIVPLNFGFAEENDTWVLYFHGAGAGKKLTLLRANGRVGFEMDTGHALVGDGCACSYTFHYQSVIGSGEVREVTDECGKLAGLRCIMAHCTGREDWDFTAQELAQVTVLRLEITQVTCKAAP